MKVHHFLNDYLIQLLPKSIIFLVRNLTYVIYDNSQKKTFFLNCFIYVNEFALMYGMNIYIYICDMYVVFT